MKVLAIILGGGRGSRLYPLTKIEAKPAVTIGGKYRLVDIPISNCLHAHLTEIYVLTQFNSLSLNHHINRAFSVGSSDRHGFVESLNAQQTYDNSSWFQGSADAVRQFIDHFAASDAEDFLILSADQLYRMDFNSLIEEHRENEADITVAVVPVKSERASQFGILRTDKESGLITSFVEKPNSDTVAKLEKAQGSREHLGSAGIYLFKREVLIKALKERKDYHDFGSEIIPAAINRKLRVLPFIHNSYWEDLGTVRAYYDANMNLLDSNKPSFRFHGEDNPIFTRSRNLPPINIGDCVISESLISDGCTIKGSLIEKSIVGVKTEIGDHCVIKRSVINGADAIARGPLRIGSYAKISDAIIDKNAQIGKHVTIQNASNVQHADREDYGFMIRDGIVIVIRNAIIPDNFII